MEEPYDVDIVDQEYPAPAPRRAMNPWLIALIVVAAVVVLCCLCACVVLLLLTPVMSTTFPAIMETMELVTTPWP
jgi:uncharacterized membrane protein YdbT with pleckstrin-like domain